MAKTKFKGPARELSKMNHRDVQRACIARGCPFELVVSLDVPGLQGWFTKHRDRTQDLNLLNEFDMWKEQIFKELGYKKGDPMFHPNLRLGYIGTKDEEGNTLTTKKPRGLGLAKKTKKKRERDEATGLFAGTKKALTFDCQRKGKTLEETVEIVMEKFPEAQEKSINIWYKKSRKQQSQK